MYVSESLYANLKMLTIFLVPSIGKVNYAVVHVGKLHFIR